MQRRIEMDHLTFLASAICFGREPDRGEDDYYRRHDKRPTGNHLLLRYAITLVGLIFLVSIVLAG
jgi:hypothetical protein